MNSPHSNSVTKIFQLLVGMSALLCLLLSYLFPFHLVPWTTFYNEWLFTLFLGLGGVWVATHAQMRLSQHLPWVLLLVLVAGHTWALGGVPDVQRTLGAVFLVFGLLGYVAYNLGLNLRGTWWLDAVLGIIWLAAKASAVVAVLQWSGIVSGADWDPGFILYSEGGGRVSSNIGQANNLGTLLVLGMGVVGYAWYSVAPKSMTWRGWAVASLLLLVLGVYLSGSRTATLNLLLWPILLGAWALWRRQPWPWLALLPIGLLGLLHLVMPPLIEWWGLFPAMEARSLVSDGTRLRLWRMVLSAIAEAPWLGHGFGAVANAHLRLSPEFGAFDFSIAQHAHNTVLDMWVIFGLPLGTLIVGIVLWMWWRAWRQSSSAAAQFVWLMTTAMLVHGLLEYPLHYGFFFWLLCLLLGVLGGQEWKTLNLRHSTLTSLAWVAVFLAVAVPVWYAYVQTELLYTAYRQRGPEVTHQLLENTPPSLGRTLYPELYERLYWVTTHMDDVLVLSDARLIALERQASRYPLPTLGWRMAFAQAARGDAVQAAWWAERMCRMFDPRVCASAQEEWQRRSAGNSRWPVLPWDQWMTPKVKPAS